MLMQRKDKYDAIITKADLSEHLNDVVGLNKREAKEMVEILFKGWVCADRWRPRTFVGIWKF